MLPKNASNWPLRKESWRLVGIETSAYLKPSHRNAIYRVIFLFSTLQGGSQTDGSNKSAKFDAPAVSFQQRLQSTSLPSGQSTIRNFMVSPAVAEQFVDCMCRLLFESCGSVPLSLLEKPRMKQAFQILGIKPPSRKWVSNTKLKQVYSETKAKSNALLEANDGCFALGCDGWRSKYVENGLKLLNFLALIPMAMLSL